MAYIKVREILSGLGEESPREVALAITRPLRTAQILPIKQLPFYTLLNATEMLKTREKKHSDTISLRVMASDIFVFSPE